MAKKTQLWLMATPGRRYSSFAGKVAVAAGAVRKFIAEHIDTHFIAEDIDTHFITNPIGTHFIAESS